MSGTIDLYTERWQAQQPVPESILQGDLEQLKPLIKLAQAMDAAQGNKACEMEEKVALLRAVAKSVGVTMEDVFPQV